MKCKIYLNVKLTLVIKWVIKYKNLMNKKQYNAKKVCIKNNFN